MEKKRGHMNSLAVHHPSAIATSIARVPPSVQEICTWKEIGGLYQKHNVFYSLYLRSQNHYIIKRPAYEPQPVKAADINFGLLLNSALQITEFKTVFTGFG